MKTCNSIEAQESGSGGKDWGELKRKLGLEGASWYGSCSQVA